MKRKKQTHTWPSEEERAETGCKAAALYCKNRALKSFLDWKNKLLGLLLIRNPLEDKKPLSLLLLLWLSTIIFEAKLVNVFITRLNSNRVLNSVLAVCVCVCVYASVSLYNSDDQWVWVSDCWLINTDSGSKWSDPIPRGILTRIKKFLEIESVPAFSLTFFN